MIHHYSFSLIMYLRNRRFRFYKETAVQIADFTNIICALKHSCIVTHGGKACRIMTET